MQLKFREVLAAIGTLILAGQASAEWRCDCTNIVGSCTATAEARDRFISVESSVAECARVDYLVDGVPFVSLVVDGSARQDWIARSESPSIIVQSCQVCLDNGSAQTAAASTPAAPDETAKRLIAVQPDYPPAAAAAGIEGHVDIRFSLSPTGTVVQPEVVDSVPSGVFDAAALAAVSRWRYTNPAPGSAPSLTERVDFKLSDAVFGLGARPRGGSAPRAASETLGNDCVREKSHYDFGAMVDVSLINACSAPLIVFSCSVGTGANRDRWICDDRDRSATLLGASTSTTAAALPAAEGPRPFSVLPKLEISRAPNSEYWWLACAVGDATCRDEGRHWARSMDRQLVGVNPQDRTRTRLGRSF